MQLSTRARIAINKLLRPINIRLDSWTALDFEHARVEALNRRGALDAPVYAVSPSMALFDPSPLTQAHETFFSDLSNLLDPARNSVAYTPQNDYFGACDASALYLLVRSLKPKRIIEVGCGNSTRVSRQAIRDGGLDTVITAIDPEPRVDVSGMIDRFEQKLVEEVGDAVFEELEAGDFLFIDSSHRVTVGNDVAHLFCRIIPNLKPGVIVHVHDVFLPYDYPIRFAREYPEWGEQYVLHALILGRDCDILWPGHYLQRDRPDLCLQFPFLSKSVAQSFWFIWK